VLSSRKLEAGNKHAGTREGAITNIDYFFSIKYYGELLTKDAGRIGGNITRRLVQMAEQQIAGQSTQFNR
jgi:hypothetical protein